MKRISKILFITILAAFLIAGSAFAFSTSKVITAMPISEPAALVIFGSCLVALGAVSRKLLSVQ